MLPACVFIVNIFARQNLQTELQTSTLSKWIDRQDIHYFQTSSSGKMDYYVNAQTKNVRGE